MLPDELLRRATSRQLTELEALFMVKEEERRAQEWRTKLAGMGGGKKRP